MENLGFRQDCFFFFGQESMHFIKEMQHPNMFDSFRIHERLLIPLRTSPRFSQSIGLLHHPKSWTSRPQGHFSWKRLTPLVPVWGSRFLLDPREATAYIIFHLAILPFRHPSYCKRTMSFRILQCSLGPIQFDVDHSLFCPTSGCIQVFDQIQDTHE